MRTKAIRLSGIIRSMADSKSKKQRRSPLKIELSFDDAMKKIIKAKPLPKKKT